jgi:hypothetical protein
MNGTSFSNGLGVGGEDTVHMSAAGDTLEVRSYLLGTGNYTRHMYGSNV